jgi:transposase
MAALYLGIDVSKSWLDTAVAWSPEERASLGRFDNDEAGFIQLAQRVSEVCRHVPDVVVHLVVEPTGGYECNLLYFAYAQGWQVTLVNVLKLRRWAEGHGVRVKTDRQDAKVLSWYGAEMEPTAQDAMDEAAQQLDDLLRRRTDLEKLRRAERNRKEIADHNARTPIPVRQSIERTLQGLDDELAAMEDAIQQLLKEFPSLRQQFTHLCSIPGVGPKVALSLLALLHRFHARTQGLGTAKELTAFVGLDPQPYESGTSIYKRTTISRKGDAHVRTLLYMGAVGGSTGHNVLRQHYQLLLARGKPKKLALIACARKMLVWAWAIFRSDQPFDPDRFNKLAQAHP